MAAIQGSGSVDLSQRMLELAEAELEAIRQGNFEDFMRHLGERQTIMDAVGPISPKVGQRERVVVNLKRVQTIDREIEMALGHLLEATRKDIEELQAGRLLLYRYGEDQERPAMSNLDVRG